jgi:CubicO group peptidase (beta-lactamase class C family)
MSTAAPGLPGDWYTDYWSDDPHAFRKVLDYLHECDPVFPPNTVFSYSNLVTSLLGVIIERLSQLSYQEYIEQRILAPLKISVWNLLLRSDRACDIGQLQAFF